MVVISVKIDLELESVPSEVWDLLAIVAIAFGILLSFVGKRFLRLVFLLLGFFVGALLMLKGLELAAENGEELSPKISLGLVLFSGVFVSFSVDNILFLCKTILLLGLTFGLVGIWNQFVLVPSSLPLSFGYGFWAMTFCICAYVVYTGFDMALWFACSFCGGLLVWLGLSRLTGSNLSLAGMWTDPELLKSCEEYTCWVPFLVGAIVCGMGLKYQTAASTRKEYHEVLLES